MTGAPRETYEAGAFIAVRREAVQALGSWEAAGVWHRLCWRAEKTGSWVATIEQIAAECMLSEHKTKQALRVIREAGWITAERASHSDRTLRWSPAWDATLGNDESPSYVEGSFPSTPSVETVETTPDPEALFPATGPVVPRSSGNRFDEWWALYPRKVEKGAARKAYAAALRKTDDQTLITALTTQLPLLREAHERGYCKHPPRWLNAECWEDQVETNVHHLRPPVASPDETYDPSYAAALPPPRSQDLYG